MNNLNLIDDCKVTNINYLAEHLMLLLLLLSRFSHVQLCATP